MDVASRIYNLKDQLLKYIDKEIAENGDRFMVSLHDYIVNESNTLLQQIDRDISIAPDQVNDKFIADLIQFISRAQQNLLFNSTDFEYREFISQLCEFIVNWSQLVHDNKINDLVFVCRCTQQILLLINAVIQLSYTTFSQAENLRKWNIFKPDGMEMQQHMVDAADRQHIKDLQTNKTCEV